MSADVQSSDAPQMGSGQMFDQIAARYDLLNRLMSLGLDRSWRRKLIRRATEDLGPGDRALDVATGTADVALALANANSEIHVSGIDPSVGMLEVGRDKVAQAEMAERIVLQEGDGQDLPYDDNAFGSCTIAFGIRNIPDRLLAIREMARVVRPGGRVLILELSEPKGPAKFYVHHIVPTLGALLSGSKEYRYLQKSIAAFPPPEDFAAVMTEAGLGDVTFEKMTMGVAHLYEGIVPLPRH